MEKTIEKITHDAAEDCVVSVRSAPFPALRTLCAYINEQRAEALKLEKTAAMLEAAKAQAIRDLKRFANAVDTCQFGGSDCDKCAYYNGRIAGARAVLYAIEIGGRTAQEEAQQNG